MGKSLHILIADDDEDDRYIISEAIKTFRTETIDIVEVTNGKELLEYLKVHCSKNCPDAILLDINMPVMDGIGALRELKKDKKLADIPVYVVSTHRHPEKLEELRQLGAQNIYSKPSSMSGYREMVQEILTS